MHELLFGAKRVAHGAVRITRKKLGRVAPGMTAARFDMMYAIGGEGRRRSRQFTRGKLEQRGLRQRLGVSPQVISRMLRSLEELGWVKRSRRQTTHPWGSRSHADARQVDVELTEVGLLCLRKAFRAVHLFLERWVYKAICWGEHRNSTKRLIQMDMLEGYFRSLRRYCRDKAALYFPWGHPDD